MNVIDDFRAAIGFRWEQFNLWRQDLVNIIRWRWWRGSLTKARLFYSRNRSILHNVVIGVVGMGALVACIGILLGPGADHLGGETVRGLHGKEKADATNAVRQTILQAAAGGVGVLVIVLTASTYHLNRRGQHTDRYVKSVGLLASDSIDEQIGALFALEQIMRESAREHQPVVSLICAFIRQRADSEESAGSTSIPLPIQTALDILGRRPDRVEKVVMDLSETYLPGADFNGGQFNRVNLIDCSLVGASFDGAQIVLSHFYGSDLEGSIFSEANADYADFSGCRLANSSFRAASLFGTRFDSAELSSADLANTNAFMSDFENANLDNAILSRANLESAKLRGASCAGMDIRGAIFSRSTGIHDEIRADLIARGAKEDT